MKDRYKISVNYGPDTRTHYTVDGIEAVRAAITVYQKKQKEKKYPRGVIPTQILVMRHCEIMDGCIETYIVYFWNHHQSRTIHNYDRGVALRNQEVGAV